MGKEYHIILGVEKGASFSEIKKAYKHLALKFHPDKNIKQNTEDRFKEIAEAFEVLSAQKRKEDETEPTKERNNFKYTDRNNFNHQNEYNTTLRTFFDGNYPFREQYCDPKSFQQQYNLKTKIINLMKSASLEMRLLYQTVARHAHSVTGRSLGNNQDEYILDTWNVEALKNRDVRKPIPTIDEWRIGLLAQLLDLRKEMEKCGDNIDEISRMIDSLCGT